MRNAKAVTKFMRVSPQKARLAAGLIRGKKAEDACLQLENSPMKGARFLLKTLKSAMANAETVLEAQRADLKVKEVLVDGGPTMKRSKSKNKGGRVPILKRTSHFTVIVSTE